MNRCVMNSRHNHITTASVCAAVASFFAFIGGFSFYSFSRFYFYYYYSKVKTDTACTLA